MSNVINFFKSMSLYNKDYFDYLKANTKVIDMPYSSIKDFVGCFVIGNECKLILPKINSIYDELIYVHEYTHALFLDDEKEIFPNLMEALYINKYVKDGNLKNEIIKSIYKEIKDSSDENHIIGKKFKLINIQ